MPERREFFVEEFEKRLGDRFRLQHSEAGLHFVAWARSDEDFVKLEGLRPELGMRPSTLAFFCMEAKLPPAFVFGFAAWTKAQLREGLAKAAARNR